MSLMASPVGDVYDGPEMLTISPADLLATADLQSGDEEDNQDLSLCYALLEFPDSYYPLRVTNVVIGRDVKVQRLMERSSDIWVDGKMVRKHPNKRKRSTTEPEEDEDEYDSDADSYYDSAPSLTLEDGTTLIGGIGGMQVHPIDIGENEQFIAVHPPADERTGQIPGLTSISKQHLRISFKDGIGWTMEVLGRNGAYLNDEHWPQNDEALLQDKDRIMIVGLQIVFRLRGPMEWHNGSVSSDDEDDDDDDLSDAPSDTIIAHKTTEIGTTRLENGTGVLAVADDDSSDEAPEKAKVALVTPASKPKIKLRLDSTLKVKPKVEKEKKPGAPKTPAEKSAEEPTPSEETKHSAEKKPVLEKPTQDTEILLQSLLAPGEIRPERRGPGRPPKNGVMSKREMRARQKAVKAGLPYEDALSAKAKGQSRTKDSEADGDDADVDGEGRKRKKVRRSETAGEEGVGAGQSGGGSDDETKKDLLTPKPPREPTPKEEDFPEERLQKPEGTYQALLHQVLSEAKAPMALQQIYEDVKRRWPYYRFRVQSNGWESSVRHNLQSNTCFMKAGKEGKGHLWTINPNVTFEPKPKRASPPPHPQPYYHHGPPPSGMQHGRPGVMHGQLTGGPYAHPYPGPYGQQPMINGHRPPIPAKSQAPSQYSSPYSPNTVTPGSQPRPLYQTGQPMVAPQTGAGGVPLKSYATHTPSTAYRPPLSGGIPAGVQHNVPPGGRPLGVGLASNHPPGQSMSNQPINRIPIQAPGHLPNQALSRPSSLASAPIGPQTTASGQRAGASGPMRPQGQQTTPVPGSQTNECSALEKVFRGQVPEIFTRFKENLRNMPGAVTTVAQETQINLQIDQTIEWIMSNARRTDFATCEVIDQPDSVKATVRILRQMLYDDHRTFKSRNSATPAAPATNGAAGANNNRVSTPQGVVSSAAPQSGQTPTLARPTASAPVATTANTTINRPTPNPTVQRAPASQPAVARAITPSSSMQASAQHAGPLRPPGQSIPGAVPIQSQSRVVNTAPLPVTTSQSVTPAASAASPAGLTQAAPIAPSQGVVQATPVAPARVVPQATPQIPNAQAQTVSANTHVGLQKPATPNSGSSASVPAPTAGGAAAKSSANGTQPTGAVQPSPFITAQEPSIVKAAPVKVDAPSPVSVSKA